MRNYKQIVKSIFNNEDSTFDKAMFVNTWKLPHKWLDKLIWQDDDIINAIETGMNSYVPDLETKLNDVFCSDLCQALYKRPDIIPLFRPQFHRFCALCIDDLVRWYPDMVEEMRPFFTVEKLKKYKKKLYVLDVTPKLYPDIFEKAFGNNGTNNVTKKDIQ